MIQVYTLHTAILIGAVCKQSVTLGKKGVFLDSHWRTNGSGHVFGRCCKSHQIEGTMSTRSSDPICEPKKNNRGYKNCLLNYILQRKISYRQPPKLVLKFFQLTYLGPMRSTTNRQHETFIKVPVVLVRNGLSIGAAKTNKCMDKKHYWISNNVITSWKYVLWLIKIPVIVQLDRSKERLMAFIRHPKQKRILFW